MDLDIRTVLRWLIIGVLAWIGLSLVGVLADIASAVLHLGLRVGVIVLVVLLAVRLLEQFRS
jgi:hypothetical protein